MEELLRRYSRSMGPRRGRVLSWPTVQVASSIKHSHPGLDQVRKLSHLSATTYKADTPVSNEIAKISLATKGLEETAARLDIKQASHIRGLHEGLVQSVETLIQERLQDVDRSLAAAPHLADHIKLSEVSGLPTIISNFNGDLATVEAQMSRTMRNYRLLQTLHFDNIWARHDRIVQAHSDTFTWIFKGVLPDRKEPIRYVEWLRERNGVFWIHGKPGSGKSTLMKFLLHHPDTAAHLQAWANGRNLVIATFFFWNSGTKLQKSQEGLLRSLLFEILRQFPALLSTVHEHIMGSQHESRSSEIDNPELGVSQYSSEVHWNLQNLLKAFEYLRGQVSNTNFCFFIDGLDEYKDEDNQDPRDLIKVLRALTTSPYIKLCLSSRSWTVFKDAFGKNPEMTVKLEDLTRKDIRRYVLDTFNEHEQFPKLSLMDPGYADLVEEVVRKAQGVFLWVFLVVRDLLEGLTYNDTIKTMRLRLDRFPEDLDAFFRHIFDSIPKVYRAQTARTFQIAMSRDEPLPLITYCFVDDVEEDPNLHFSTSLKLDQQQIEAKLAVMWRRLDGRSRGLLEVIGVERKRGSSGDADFVFQVEFLHRTVRDFILHTPDIQNEMMGNLENKVQTWVLLCRATSLMVRYWPQGEIMVYLQQLFHFAQLAVTDSCNERIVDEVFLNVFQQTRRSEVSVVGPRDGSTLEIGFFDICLASEYGLISYVKRQLTQRLRLMNEFSSSSSEEKMELLLGGVLRHALLGEDSYGKLSPELVEYLVSLGASPNYLCKREGKDATVFALFLRKLEREEISPKDCGVLEIVKTLLAHDADPYVNMDSALSWKYDSSPRVGLPINACAKHVISKHFTSEQVVWLFSHATRATSPEHEHEYDKARNLQVEQEKKQELHQPWTPGPKSYPSPSRTGWWHKYPQYWRSQRAPGRHVFQDKLYPIKVENVNRKMVLDDHGETRNGTVEALSKENNVRVAKVAWLSKKDIPNPYGSMVVYVTRSDDATRLLTDGFVYGGGQHGHTRVFERRPPSVQCYNCQQIGHKANQCRNAKVCPK
jgi:glycosyltransferase involved in cell wall biosynthesis